MKILDPFAGSGTVLYECARKNISAYGIELNISAYLMSKKLSSKILCFSRVFRV